MQSQSPLQQQALRVWLRAHPVLGALGVGLSFGVLLGLALSVEEGGPLGLALLLSVPMGVLFFGPFVVWAAWRDKQDFGEDPLKRRPAAQLPSPRIRRKNIALMSFSLAIALFLAIVALGSLLDALPKGKHLNPTSNDVAGGIVTALLTPVFIWTALSARRRSKGIPRRRPQKNSSAS
jgi:hypothetical protein